MDALAHERTKALLLIVHPDDEIIFCAGTMLAYPACEWSIVAVTDDERPLAFTNAVEHLKRLGVRIVFHKTLNQQDAILEKAAWEKAIRDEQLNPDIVITHNVHGEYGHPAHKLLSKVADSLFSNVWKFVYPVETSAEHAKDQEFFKVHLDADMLEKKKALFTDNYPSEHYIWKALKPVMDHAFASGTEWFSHDKRIMREKKNMLVMLPDRFVKSVGGIGANSGPVFDALSQEYNFYVAAYPLAGTPIPSFVADYHEVAAPYTEVKSGVVNVLLCQPAYMAAAIRFPKPDLVFAFDWSIYQAATETAKFFGVPLIARMSMSPILLSEQGYRFGLNIKNPFEKSLHNAFCEMEIRGLKSADRIVHVSRNYLERYNKFAPALASKSRMVIDGIDTGRWDMIDGDDIVLPGKNKIKIIFLGRLSEVKGIIPLCAAKVPGNIDLIFIGPKETADAVCLSKIEEKTSKEGNVYYMGALYGDDKIRALKAAHALIMPSYHESFGGVALEGLAAGCIVLSSRAYGLSDFLDDQNSIFCGTTAQEIEAAYQAFLNQTEKEKEEMRRCGFGTAEKLTIRSTAAQLKSVFEELV